jgi:putative phage-type endonuclease
MQHLTQQSPEWLSLRRTKIGASDAPVIMGVSPWKTPYQLWLEKLNLFQQPVTWQMKEGLRKEEEARQEFERITGIIVFPQVLVSEEHEFMMASLDGIDIEFKTAVEIKCPGEKDHEVAMSGIVPTKYYPQLQQQMFVANLDKMFYFSRYKDSSKLIEIYRNDSYIDDLISKEKEFFYCMEHLEAPELTQNDYKERNDDIWNQTAQKWLSINSQIKDLEKQELEIRKSLEDMSGKSNTKGGGISLYQSVRKGQIDYKSIPEIQNVNLEKYRKENSSFLRITRDKNNQFLI